MSEQEPAKKPTLSDFIEENSKLVSGLAAFVALTAFSLQLEKTHPNLVGLSGVALLGAVLLCLELFAKVPLGPRHWRLLLFQLVLLAMLYSLGSYWFSNFPELWLVPLIAVVPAVLVFLVSALLTHTFGKAVKIAARVFNRSIDPERFKRRSQFAFVSFMLLSVGGYIWILHSLSGREIHIRLPHF